MSTEPTAQSRRAAIVIPVLNRFDAISTAAVDHKHLLDSLPGWDARILTCHDGHAGVPVSTVGSVADLLRHVDFLAADLIIYHFGLHHALFDALLIGNGRGKQIVRFHNVTPSALLRPQDDELIRKSLRQIANFAQADLIWADSETNAEELMARGFRRERIDTIPLVVATPARSSLVDRSSDIIEILFLGRFVRSKGVLDLLKALARLDVAALPSIRLRLAGNLAYSDSEYVEAVKRAADSVPFDVEFLGTIDDATRDAALRSAHILAIPSYHEGFCKPVIEGLRAGCIPVGYSCYNLPDICHGLCRLVTPGDIGALSGAVAELVCDLSAMKRDGPNVSLRLDRGRTSAAAFGRIVDDYTLRFEFPSIRAQTISSLRRIMPDITGTRDARFPTLPIINVQSDDIMRGMRRRSLNRLPDLTDWEAGGHLSEVMRALGESVSIHRKSWEYAMCLHGLETLGVVHPEAEGLAIGAGSEKPLYYYANVIRRMVATDLYESETHEGTPLMLKDPEQFAPFPYRQDRLEVYRMPGDKLEFGDDSFDFIFCLSSIEHFGSRDTQRRALDEMARVLKPGGVACVITEMILTDHYDAEYFQWCELEDIFLSHATLKLDGGRPDLSISESLVTFPVNLTGVTWPLTPEKASELNRSPHIVLRRGEMLWTSFSMFLRKSPVV